MVEKLRVGAVNYLNTKPLIRHLPSLAPQIELVLDVPSQLALDLEEGRLDIGLIPSIEYFRVGRYTILPDVSISSFGPVLSVKLCSQEPLDRIRRLAVDEGSRTSIVLAEILLDYFFGIRPELEQLPLYKDPSESQADAVLLIGDRAMRVQDGTYRYTFDLGYEWSCWTGLPFVFAFWAVRDGVEVPPNVREAFVRAKELGRPEIPAIASEEAKRLGIDEVRCRYYLEQVIRHDLGREEMAGLERFYELAVKLGVVPQGVACEFCSLEDLAKSR